MAKSYFLCMVLQRAVLSIILTFCILYRPVGLTLPYLLLLLYLPFVPVATAKTIRGHTGYFFQISIALTVLILLVQIAFQIVLATLGEQIISSCNFLEIVLRHVGIIKFNGMAVISILEWFLPDIVMLISTPSIYLLLRRLTATDTPDVESAGSTEHGESNQISNENLNILKKIGVFLSMIALLLASTLQPSVPGAVYFIVFLGAATWWACYRELDRAFAIICRVVLVFLAVHIVTLLAYQTPWPQEYFTDNSTIIRFLGFSSLYIYPNCTEDTDFREFYFNQDANLEAFLNPVAILLCFFTLAISSHVSLNTKANLNNKRAGAFSQLENGAQHIRQVSFRLKKKPISKKVARSQWHGAADKVRDLTESGQPSEPNERTPLMRRSMKSLNTFKTFKRDTSVDGGDGSIPMDDLNENGNLDEDMPPTLCEQFCFGLEQVGDFLFKNSYILSNIIMMVWSIVYHSWITFIFLLWANLLFIIPNQRKNMLRCSPSVVIYAELLLLAQYLYGMNLTEAELPSKSDINGINLAQIGFIRYDNPCLPLLLKTLFTLTFWVTLRQKAHETRTKRQSSTLAHLAAPFQVTVGAATTADMASKNDDKKSKFIVMAGNLLNAIFLQLWIWIVVLVLFLCAIYGQKMTAIRIVYMTLVLVFLITFQWSFQIWRKIMYTFWVVVIGFAMLTLILIYTYQFDRFDEYWMKYLKIPVDLQTDLGLEKFETKDLFFNLVYPTLVVIITVVQLQIFHKKYLEALDAPMNQRNADDQSNNPTSSVNYGNLEADTSDDTISKKERNIQFKDLKGVTSKQISEWFTLLYEKVKEFLEFVWLFLEIHFTKVILFVAFAVGIREVSVLHLLLILMASIAVTSRTYVQSVFTRCISLVIAVLLILKMIYQIQYIDQNKYNVQCDNQTIISANETVNNATINDANWFGFYKITGRDTLATVLKGYIGYILITTIHTIILMRQKRNRFLSGKPMTRPKVLFPRITRQDADRDVLSMLKYMANFVFYKFGIEITLIMLVALIGTRMDVVALMYTVWLCVLFVATREKQKQLWPFFQWFIFALIPVQYIAVIGIPPFVCVDLSKIFSTDILQNLQKWAMLPEPTLREQSSKLFLDFTLLMFACRQMLVFRIENQYEKTQSEFPGGSNKSVIEDINNMTTKPITNSHDFVTYTRNWLDILKCAVFLGFYWMTLAIVFLAGTNRTNLFSLGYLIGSFIFLWQGADFYLRPIRTIIRYWSYLIGYNIFVIAMKTLMQIPACIFTQELDDLCWFRQLLGIGCIRKFGSVASTSSCKVPSEGIGLAWDGICFAFLLLQLRIFDSYYFCHIINESKASTILASRGAELIEGLRRKQVKLQIQREEEILLKIKQKMDRIKANQQKFQPIAADIHRTETVAPLARTTSMSSCAGYHTPIEDEVAASELPSDFGRSISILNAQAPSPMSAVLTVSLDGYLDHQQISYGSPPSSDIIAVRRGPSSEESYPVFSPLPTDYREQCTQTQNLTVAPTVPSINSNTLQPGLPRGHRRQSSVNTVSWTDQGDSSIGRSRPLSNNLDPSDEKDEIEQVTLRTKSGHRRQSSVGISWNKFEDQRRRSSYASWARDDDDADDYEEISRSTRTRSRPCSWGPVGEFYFRESMCLSETDRSMLSHQAYGTDGPFEPATHRKAILSGDYYLFEDMNENLELNLLHEKPNVAVEDDVLKRNISKRPTLEEVIVGKTKAQRLAESKSSVKLSKVRCVSLPEEPIPEKDPRGTFSEPIQSATGFATSSPKHLKDDFDQPDGQKPGPSRASVRIIEGSDEELSAPSDTVQAEGSFLAKIKSYISGLMVSVTLRLYKMSRNYRYVTKVLAKEKKELKAEKDFGQGHRIGTGNVWAPLPSILRTRGESTPQFRDSPSPSTTDLTITQMNDDSELVHDEQNGTTIAHLLRPTMFSTKKEEKSPEEERRTSVVPEIRILAPSLERGLDDSSQKYPSKEDIDSIKDISEIEEDFYTQEHSLFTEFVTSLWFALISNTDLVCYLLVFINMVASASVLAMPISFMVFLWGTLSVPRPSKTFWVTIIAYTQVIVLIKCFCQFEFLWVHIPSYSENNPLAIPRILGFERKKNYAAYDLALLMVVFFHRFIQKQMGIWRSTDDDEEYKGRNGKEVIQTAVVQRGRIPLTSPNQEETTADDEKLVSRDDEGEATGEYKRLPKKALVSTKRYCSICTIFFHKLLTQTNRVTTDLYLYIFLCDFFNFFVLLFGFSAFGSSQGDGGVASYVEENKIPVAFMIMLLLQFVFIIVDRALYLRKNLVGKIVFQFISVIGMHIWLFFLVPALSERSFNAKAPPVIYYLFKCCYFLLSAYQIRCGYPRRILGNCLTKGFSIFNLGAFKVYMLTPFLFELRALMDWIWTDTTMPLFEWLKMEDIFANIYEIKCSRQMEEDFPAPRGVPKKPLVKYIMGGGFLLAVIALIWGPLALFALGNTVGAPNPPLEVSVELKVGPYEPIYRMSAQSSKIFQFTPAEFNKLSLNYKKNKIALTFLSNYENVDVTAVNLGSNSTALWIISPPDLKRLTEDLSGNATLKVRYKYSVTRKSYSEKMLPTISMEASYDIKEDDAPTRDALVKLITTNTTERLELPYLFPKFLKVKNVGSDLKVIPQLMTNAESNENENIEYGPTDGLRNILLQMHMTGESKWWEVLESCKDASYVDIFAKLPHADCKDNLVLYAFSDKLFPETLSFITAGGVIGIYTTFVFLASRFFRSIFSGGSSNIIFSELPYVDRILQLCLDIYLVRESLEFSLEEDLFAKLIFLYRSPETMIKWTRPADEQSNDDDTENSENKDELEKDSKKNQ